MAEYGALWLRPRPLLSSVSLDHLFCRLLLPSPPKKALDLCVCVSSCLLQHVILQRPDEPGDPSVEQGQDRASVSSLLHLVYRSDVDLYENRTRIVGLSSKSDNVPKKLKH